MSIFFHCAATNESAAAPAATEPRSLRSTAQVPLRETILLDRQGLHSVPLGANESIMIEGLGGLCWVTIEGDRMDYAVEPGQHLRLQGPGLVLIEGLHPANAIALGDG